MDTIIEIQTSNSSIAEVTITLSDGSTILYGDIDTSQPLNITDLLDTFTTAEEGGEAR